MHTRMKPPFDHLIWLASHDHHDRCSHVDPAVLEKFAELVVKECLTVIECSRTGSYNNFEDAQRMSHMCAVLKKKIARHFGVDP